MNKEKNEIRSSAHKKYRCQYHIVFAPKFRRKEIYGTLKKDIGQILRKLCEQKDVQIIEAEACPDYLIPDRFFKEVAICKFFKQCRRILILHD